MPTKWLLPWTISEVNTSCCPCASGGVGQLSHGLLPRCSWGFALQLCIESPFPHSRLLRAAAPPATHCREKQFFQEGRFHGQLSDVAHEERSLGRQGDLTLRATLPPLTSFWAGVHLFDPVLHLEGETGTAPSRAVVRSTSVLGIRQLTQRLDAARKMAAVTIFILLEAV